MTMFPQHPRQNIDKIGESLLESSKRFEEIKANAEERAAAYAEMSDDEKIVAVLDELRKFAEEVDVQKIEFGNTAFDALTKDGLIEYIAGSALFGESKNFRLTELGQLVWALRQAK